MSDIDSSESLDESEHSDIEHVNFTKKNSSPWIRAVGEEGPEDTHKTYKNERNTFIYRIFITTP